MALTDRLFNDLQVQLPGAIENAIRRELYNTLDDFCRESFAWRETIEISLTAGVITYAVTPAGTEIVRVYSIDHDTFDVKDATYEFGEITFETAPTSAHVSTPAYLVAALTPAIGQGVDPEALIPSDMWSKWHRAFLAGTLARMMAQSAKPYSNPAIALYHQRVYNQQKAIATHDARTGGTPGAQMWSFPRFA
jgi:hypothetical protein